MLGAVVTMNPALEVMESGDYMIVPRSSGNVAPGYEWLVGTALHVDREAGLATIRYTRDGTTHEVRYTLEQW